MLTVTIGGILAVIVICIYLPRCDKGHGLDILFVIIMILATLIGGFSPISGYNEWELIEEMELISLSNDVDSKGNGMIYVTLSADNVYTYRDEISSEIGTLTGKNVEEVEDPNCEVPVIRVYRKVAKATIWTYGLYSKTKYVFYVPEGTIYKEVNLN